ncbi:LOW QUALITY PROTEIN: RNA polymerase II subunit A C-terminal domain phosphatase SSU72 like protein 3-like [Dugong dugon]
MFSSPVRLPVVCMNNINWSTEVNRILRKKGFNVQSFGTGSHVNLAGPGPNLSLVYDFATSYQQMYDDLVRKDRDYYMQNGMLHILGRSQRIKSQPERFQECRDAFDVMVTYEETVYDRVVEELCSREQETFQPVHMINMDIKDTLKDVILGAFLICELCQLIQADDMEDSLDELLLELEKTGKSFLHVVCFY